MIRRVPLTLTLFAALFLVGSASAQSARATGIVRDTDGKGVKGATIRATNPDAVPPQIVSTTDDKGRWAILGMRIGTYSFRVEAPGFLPVQADANVRTAVTPPLQFTLARDPGPIPGALPSNIQAQLSAANMLRDQGRPEEAAKALSEIDLAGGKGNLFEVSGKRGTDPMKIVTAFVHRDARSWFFKLQGSPAAVDSQKAAYLEFLRSVKFDAPAAAPNASTQLPRAQT